MLFGKQNFYCFRHTKSVAKILLFFTFRERLIDSKTMLPLKGGEMHPSISRLDQ